MAWRVVAAKAAVVAIAVLVPALFVGNGLYLLTHGWFVRAEYARPGFPDDELGMKTPERTRLAEVGLYSILPWHRDGIERLERARLDDGSVAFDERELRHMRDVRRLLSILLGLHALCLVSLVVLAAVRRTRDLARRALRAGALVTLGLCAFVAFFLRRQAGLVPDRLPHDLLQRQELALRRPRDAAAALPRPVLERHDAAARRRRAAPGRARARRDAVVGAARIPGSARRTKRAMAGRTQAALYAEIDLELSWSEDALPQVERTKHVHGLHPYLGQVRAAARRGLPAPLLRAGQAASTTRSRARGRRSSRRTRSAPTRSAATSRRSTAC